MTTYPFFNINSEPLKQMLAVNDRRSILNRLSEIGVQIRGKGKSRYVITEEVIEALKEDVSTGYTPKSSMADL